MTKKLVATKSFSYAGKRLVKGAKFEASDKDARLLKAVGKAKDAPARAEKKSTSPEPQPEKDAPSGETGASHVEKTGEYQTRMMLPNN
jgi:hypothetical protein